MIGQTWPAEGRTFKDELTGRPVRQLTQLGNNYHLYFTENAFDHNGASIIFSSDRASGVRRVPHDDPHYNVFRLDLASGVITQLTDEPSPVTKVTKTPDSRLIVYITGDKLKLLDTQNGEISVVYAEAGPYDIGSPSISPNRRSVGFTRNEDLSVRHGVDPAGGARYYHGPNYAGFKERYYLVKDGRITIANLDGSGWYDAMRDTHQVGHFQFSPDDPTIAMYCHEGPWNLVTQRMWGIDLAAREVWPLFRQEEKDSIGHEFWTQDGYVFFDNRGPHHDGTITSDRTQAVVTEVAVNENEFDPYVGLMNRWGRVVRQIGMPYYCNHYHANPDNSLLVGDDVDDLVLIDIGTDTPMPQTLCRHGTSWHTQTSHCHPTWSWDGRRILYASDKGGQINLYLLDMEEM